MRCNNNEKCVLSFPQSVLNQLPLAPKSDVLPLCYQDSADSTSQFIEHVPLLANICNFSPHPPTPLPPFWAQHIPHMSVTAKICITITGFHLPLWGATTNENFVLPFPQSVLNRLPLAPKSDVLPLCCQDSADSTSQFIEHVCVVFWQNNYNIKPKTPTPKPPINLFIWSLIKWNPSS